MHGVGMTWTGVRARVPEFSFHSNSLVRKKCYGKWCTISKFNTIKMRRKKAACTLLLKSKSKTTRNKKNAPAQQWLTYFTVLSSRIQNFVVNFTLQLVCVSFFFFLFKPCHDNLFHNIFLRVKFSFNKCYKINVFSLSLSLSLSKMFSSVLIADSSYLTPEVLAHRIFKKMFFFFLPNKIVVIKSDFRWKGYVYKCIKPYQMLATKITGKIVHMSYICAH